MKILAHDFRVGLVLSWLAVAGCTGKPAAPKAALPDVEALLAEADADPARQSDMVLAGSAVFEQSRCATCHGFDDMPRTGPRLDGLYDRPVTLTDGTTKPRDRAYLWRAITDPKAEIVAGFRRSSMSNFGQVMDHREVAELITYLESRGRATSGE